MQMVSGALGSLGFRVKGLNGQALYPDCREDPLIWGSMIRD